MREESAYSQESVKPGDHGQIGFGWGECPKIVDGVVATLARTSSAKTLRLAPRWLPYPVHWESFGRPRLLMFDVASHATSYTRGQIMHSMGDKK